MAKSTTTTPAVEALVINRLKREHVRVCILGESGLYCHRMSQKAQRDLLIGGRKKTTADKARIKHDPRVEFRSSLYTAAAPGPAYVLFPAMAFKRAMRTAAIETDGIKGTTIDRLVYIEEEFVPVFGRPVLRMDITRSSDMARTPDVRTRAYFAKWATAFNLSFVKPALSLTAITTLLENAGAVVGIGDNRQERGKGSFGRFRTVTEKEIAPIDIGYEAQVAAVEAAEPDAAHGDTAVLLAEFDAEVDRRR